MERVGDMTREELKRLVGEVVEEQVTRALRENGVARNSQDSGRNGRSRRERLAAIQRNSKKLNYTSKSWSNPVVEEREAVRNWKPSRELKGHEWVTEERRIRGLGSHE